jgi:transmembrane sensor
MSAEETEKLAAQWLARSDRGLTDAENLALAAWLDESLLNRVAWLRLKASWTRAERLAALKGPALAIGTRESLRPRLLLAIAACLVLVVGCGALLVWRLTATEQVFATGIGRIQAIRLADGSHMELNTSTKVHADVRAARRTVTLESGEAYFDVVHDDRHPFTVYAGNRRITDLGTKFSVYRNGDDVRVLVREGRVQVDILNKPEVDAPVVAEAGHAVMSKGGETLVLAKPDRAIADDLSWRSGMLVFNQQTLTEAAEQFNRYNARELVVEGEARKIRIGGSFKADNVDVFVLLLHRGFGLSVNDQGKRITVSR